MRRSIGSNELKLCGSRRVTTIPNFFIGLLIIIKRIIGLPTSPGMANLFMTMIKWWKIFQTTLKICFANQLNLVLWYQKKKKTESSFDVDWNDLYSSSINLESLDYPFTMDDIKYAIFSFDVDRSSGPDGFPFGFFQQFWDIIHRDFFDLFQQLYDSNLNLSRLSCGTYTKKRICFISCQLSSN